MQFATTDPFTPSLPLTNDPVFKSVTIGVWVLNAYSPSIQPGVERALQSTSILPFTALCSVKVLKSVILPTR